MSTRSDADNDSVPAEGSGWDANSVWRERVQRPRAQAPAPLANESTSTGPVSAPDSGWDPTETWRFRVLNPLTSGEA